MASQTRVVLMDIVREWSSRYVMTGEPTDFPTDWILSVNESEVFRITLVFFFFLESGTKGWNCHQFNKARSVSLSSHS